jgi:hypothetical protein
MEPLLPVDPFLLEAQRRNSEQVSRILTHLQSKDERTLELAKDIAAFTYGEERKKSDVIEQRAFGLMQFAKVGLTIIVGITGVISAANVQDTPLRESLIFLLSVAGAFLAKLFYRGLNVVKIGTFFRPHLDTLFKPDHFDIYETQAGETYIEALRLHIARMIWYFNHTADDNLERIRQCKCCFVNSFGFLAAFLAFFVLSIVHLLEPRLTLILPAHRIIGASLFVLALITDGIADRLHVGWFKVETKSDRF